jgi:hypothetical protein
MAPGRNNLQVSMEVCGAEQEIDRVDYMEIEELGYVILMNVI